MQYENKMFTSNRSFQDASVKAQLMRYTITGQTMKQDQMGNIQFIVFGRKVAFNFNPYSRHGNKPNRYI